MTCLKIAALTQEYENAYWRLVKQDYCDYYFFIYDLQMQKEQSKVSLAIDSDRIVGLMLIYLDRVAQLRGSPEAVGLLLSSLRLSEVDIQAPPDCEDMVLARYPIFKHKENMSALILKKGNEKTGFVETAEKLSFDDAEEVAQLMRESYPLMWSGMTADQVKEFCRSEANVWYGIRKQGKLVSFGSAILTENIGLVTWLATLETYRCRGYCSSVLSKLVTEGLKKADKMMIYVMDDNTVANHVYHKVGFERYKSYFLCSI